MEQPKSSTKRLTLELDEQRKKSGFFKTGSKLVRRSRRILKTKLEAIKLGCEHLSYVRACATSEIDKVFQQWIMPPKLFRGWVEEAEEIEREGNDILNSYPKGVSSSDEIDQLLTLLKKVVDHLHKSPFDPDLTYDGAINIPVVTPNSITEPIPKYNFIDKTKVFDIHITKFKTKATTEVEDRISPAQEKQAEGSIKVARLPEELHGKEAGVATTSFLGESGPVIKGEATLRIPEIEELPPKEGSVSGAGWTKRESGLSARDKLESESELFPGSESASMSKVQEKLTSKVETAEPGVMPEQRNEAMTSDAAGFKELTPSLSVQRDAENKTECEITEVPETEPASVAEQTSASSIETEVEPGKAPLSIPEILPAEEFEIPSTSSEIPRAHSFGKTSFETKISASETEGERQLKPELNAESTNSIMTSVEGINLQLVIFHGGHSTEMHNAIKDSEVLFREEDYFVFVRTAKKIEKPPKPESAQGKISEGEGSLSSLLERPETTNISLPEDFILQEAGKGLTKPPLEEKWGRSSVIDLTGNRFSSLPEKPNWSNVRFLFLQNNRWLTTISNSYFEDMHSLLVVDLSRTRVRSLPTSLFKHTGLQALFLRDCENSDELPPEVGNLRHLELLDLWGTEVYNLPGEIAKLKHLRSLQVSFYGPVDHSEYLNLPPDLISPGIISQLLELQAFRILVDPADARWNYNAEAITHDVSSLSKLAYLQFYFPEVQFLEIFIRESRSWRNGCLGKFNFVVGQDIKRVVSRVPADIEAKYDEHDRCLRFVNGDGTPEEVAVVLKRVTAFYLDHHYEIKNFSKFGITNCKELKFCVLRECPKIVEIIDSEGRTDGVLPCLQHLSLHYLWRLERIWKGPLPRGSLAMLKFLLVHTCPNLEFVLTWSMLHCLSNMVELIVEDCESVKVIIEIEGQTVNGAILPCLQRLSLHYLWRLESICRGSVPQGSLDRLKFLSVRACPKLEFIITWSMLCCLSNMEELIVEDCESVEVIIDMEDQTVDCAIHPRLKNVELRRLPQLVSLWHGVYPMLEQLVKQIYSNITIDECPKLKLLQDVNSTTEEIVAQNIPRDASKGEIVSDLTRDSGASITGKDENKKIKATVVLMKKNVSDFNALILDSLDELLGQKVSLQLISAVNGDPEKGLRAKLGKPTYLEGWITTITSLTAGDSAFKATFDWDEEIGVPGAFIIRNSYHKEFYLKTLTLDDVPGHGHIHFVCNSWVYPADNYKTDRVFFANKTYLPSETPAPLVRYREEELVNLRGDGTEKLEEWDRVYDYAYYNDLGDPDKGSQYARPILGGSIDYPYPRRGRTGRPPTETDPESESRLPLMMSLNIYVPRDEQFGELKMSDSAYALKSIVQFLVPEFEALCDNTPDEFGSFQDTLKLYEDGIKRPLPDSIMENIPSEMLKQLVPIDGEEYFKFPMPQVLKEDKTAWRTDEEFAREMLAGVHPVIIRRLQEFPPSSKLDPEVYGNQNSSMTSDHIENNLDGLTIIEAMKNNRLFILDHHDALMPYLRRINTTTTKTYATRTLLFLQKDGTLMPLAIELSLPHPEGDQFGAISGVYTPAENGVEGSIWQLAKAYAVVNDSGYHQLISHWLNTHAVIEPFVIATNRQLSVLHPIYKLLHPHFRDTMNINALARQILINAGGILEKTIFPAKYAMEMSAVIYMGWVLPEQALPADLIKRGMAVEDANAPNGLRLLIEDYPYAVDGLAIWSAIGTWVEDYCNFYYTNDEMLQEDSELQSWWKELREEGHGDKKDEPWWPKMQTREELIDTCTIVIWVASALHAAVAFGQYPYAGYMPNRPTISRRFMPEKGSPEYEELKSDPEKAFLKTITAKLQTLLGISLLEIMSRHSLDEVYLGQRQTPDWTADTEPLEAFERFGKKLAEIEEKIINMNKDEKWRNRVGPVNVPYTLLFPTSEGGLTGKGIPNSVSI